MWTVKNKKVNIVYSLLYILSLPLQTLDDPIKHQNNLF